MAESPILDRIDGFVEEEHRLWAESEQERLDEAGHTDEPASDPDVPRDIP